MLNFILGAICGSIVFGLILRNNPKLADKLLNVVNKIKDKLDKED